MKIAVLNLVMYFFITFVFKMCGIKVANDLKKELNYEY